MMTETKIVRLGLSGCGSFAHTIATAVGLSDKAETNGKVHCGRCRLFGPLSNQRKLLSRLR